MSSSSRTQNIFNIPLSLKSWNEAESDDFGISNELIFKHDCLVWHNTNIKVDELFFKYCEDIHDCFFFHERPYDF